RRRGQADPCFRREPAPLYESDAVDFLNHMSRPTRSLDWGFPRWRGYESARETAKVRLCDRHGCLEPGNCPAPKSPNNPDRWHFCQKHAAEYNSKWDYFEGLEKAEAEAREKSESSENAGYSA